MRVPRETGITAVMDKVLQNTIDEITVRFRKFMAALNGALTFGDGVDIDNISGRWMTFTAPTTPDEEIILDHNLGVIPCGFLVMIPPTSGTVNRTATPWTTTSLALSCSSGSETVTIFVLIPPLSA